MIAIVSMLIALLLPAVQAARGSARKTSCQTKLRQIGLALLHFHEAQGKFPAGGWGRAWVPIPERGVGERQPGGWVYQALPYLEQGSLHRASEDVAGSDGARVGIGIVDVALPLFHCPSRRVAIPRAAGTRFGYQRNPRPGGALRYVARGDYAINAGASHAFRFTGPQTVEDGDRASYWEREVTDNKAFSGISHLHRSVSMARVTDGASKTYLGGEKFLAPKHYEDGGSLGDDETLFSGFANDNHRFGASRAQGAEGADADAILYYPPLRDTDEDLDPAGHPRFGSAHPAALHLVFCDGSVSAIAYSVDPGVHYLAAHRADRGSFSQ